MQDAPDSLPEVFVIEDAVAATGLAEACDRGRAEGELMAYRHALRQVLELRFGVLPEALARRVESEPDTGRVVAWHAQAVTLRRLADFEL